MGAIRSFGIIRGENCQKHTKNGKYAFFARIDHLCDQKIDSIIFKIESIFFKNRRDRFDHGRSFLKIKKIKRSISQPWRLEQCRKLIIDPFVRKSVYGILYHLRTLQGTFILLN